MDKIMYQKYKNDGTAKPSSGADVRHFGSTGEMFNTEMIDNVVCEIMFQDGPDRHIDGHEIITDFILSCLNDNFNEWVDEYRKKKNNQTRYI